MEMKCRMMPLVSIVIPTFKRPDFLKRTLESVLKQTYENIEIIVVDDNNKDINRTKTENIMDNYSNYINIIYIKHEKNKGGSAARNTGWKNSNGKYITFIDDDDEIDENKILRQVECLEKLDNSWGVCYTSYHVLKPGNKIIYSAEKRSGELYVESLARTLFMGSGSNLLLRKSIVDFIGGYDESFIRNQDIEFLVRVLEITKIAYVDEDLLTVHLDENRKKMSWENYELYTKHYLDNFSNRIDLLNPKNKKRVKNVISLECARVAMSFGYANKSISILYKNKVSIKAIFLYLLYILDRLINKKSYGFMLK